MPTLRQRGLHPNQPLPATVHESRLWPVLVSNPAKRKGDSFERLIVEYLRSEGYTVDRTRAGWSDDRGDIHGIEGVVLECKNHKTLAIPAWLEELRIEMVNAGCDMGAVVHKRRGSQEGADQYATLPLRLFVQLLKKAGYA
jgi:hypothetical protein